MTGTQESFNGQEENSRPEGVVSLFEGDDHMIGLVLINSGYRSNLLFSFAHVLELRWGISLSGPECVATICDDWKLIIR